MRIWSKWIVVIAATAGLTSCAGGLMRVQVDRVRSFETENSAFLVSDIILNLDLYNANKKKLTFEGGRCTLLVDGKAVTYIDLVGDPKPSIGASGTATLRVPLRVRMTARLLQLALDKEPRPVGIDAALQIRKGESNRLQTVRFKRTFKSWSHLAAWLDKMGFVDERVLQQWPVLTNK